MIACSIFTFVNIIVDKRIIKQYNFFSKCENVLVLLVSVLHTHNTGHKTMESNFLYFTFSQQVDYVAAKAFSRVADNRD